MVHVLRWIGVFIQVLINAGLHHLVLEVGTASLSMIVGHIIPVSIVLTLVWIGWVGSTHVASSGLGALLEISPVLIG